MNDAPASIFSQINIDNEEVVFMQTDMSLANDSFFCTVTNQDAIIYDQRFDVRVVPLVKEREPFKVSLKEMLCCAKAVKRLPREQRITSSCHGSCSLDISWALAL